MGNVEIPKWLEGLPLAPEFHPTDTEFADPIAYISKIEKKASAFGICKIIPPLPKPSKRYVISNLNKSLSKCPELGQGVNLSNACSSSKTGLGDCGNDGEGRAVFTTRQQELGQGIKKMKGLVKENPQLGVHKQVWQSGEVYTLDQFELKSKAFAKSLLGLIKEINPLVIETLFWKAASEKPIYVEYANDVPGSGFGEPEGQFQYFHRRRRKRASYKSYRRSIGSSNCKENERDSVNNSFNNEMRGAAIKNDTSISPETISRPSISSPTLFSEETAHSSKRKSVNASTDMEGSAGWKLSNSPWNLQVIARSPGSLTRFMPDDIPGVTSPMVYIGMLFSWFAWHVEDHELHSMNFLHTGSPKTWYAVPGDYAFTFEEVIRAVAYGGSIDRLAALSLLGEKTTLLSPEVIISSGIPCCRLVQNPGEFVVTFPRAYHVGFSHGFNCGEAANFGTPQWLKVAKEAAVRRAAMNYLPMLSHQQLLYLLTMSFVSRIPRSLLPGARSSRLRDRLKEERELSVKKAFIEDMLNENNILSALLGRDSTYNFVIWNPDLLPSANKDSQVPITNASSTEEIVSHNHSKDNSSDSTQNDLFKEMSLYMETLNDLYMDDHDDLSCDFQVDSGTVACVACGILGFPFMCVVQPSERASVELLPPDHPLVLEQPRVSESCHSSAACDGSSLVSVADLPLSRGFNNSSKFLRPRIFCLEHGVQIEELLQSKGGANMLVICHSDYQKMKAHAGAVAEEIDMPFTYTEVPLESASQEDLNLIYLAIDEEDHDECGEDWTSKLGINLRYCVKVRKNSPSNKVQHALALGGLFSDKSSSDFSNIKWQSRRSRSTAIRPAHCKPCTRIETKKDVSAKMSDNVIVRKEEKLIQYTRKKYKVKIDCSTSWDQGFPRRHAMKEVSVSSCEDHTEDSGKSSMIIPCNVRINGTDSAGLGLSPTGMSGVLHEVQVLEATEEMFLNSAPMYVTGSLLTANAAVESVVRQVENPLLEKSNEYENACNISACSNIRTQYEGKVEGINDNGDSVATSFSSRCLPAVDERCEMPDEYQTSDSISLINETHKRGSEEQHNAPAVADVTHLAKAACLHTFHPPVGQLESIGAEKSWINNELVVEKSCVHNEVCDSVSVNMDKEMKQELQTTGKSDDSQCISFNNTQTNQLSVSLEESSECPVQATSGSNKALLFCSVARVDIDKPTAASGEDISSEGISAEEGLCTVSTLDSKTQSKVPTTHIGKVEAFVPNSTSQLQDPITPVTAEEYSEFPKQSCITEDLSVGLNFESKVLKESQSDDVVPRDDGLHKIHGTTSATTEEHLLSNVTQISQQNSTLIQRYSETEEESCSTANVHKSLEDCSSHELESIEYAVVDYVSNAGKGRKRKNEVEQLKDNNLNSNCFIKSPCEGLRPRTAKEATFRNGIDLRKSTERNPVTKKARNSSVVSVPSMRKREIINRSHKCDLEGCPMSFETKAELQLHKRNRCPYEGCRKRFNSHKYAVIHQRVHEDDRPLKCPWKGCSMSFKWAWARTEHIRVHTGEKPYKCKVEGCGRSFRFVSDFSRHRRKTGHYVNTPA